MARHDNCANWHGFHGSKRDVRGLPDFGGLDDPLKTDWWKSELLMKILLKLKERTI
jgi:hypothetical protein